MQGTITKPITTCFDYLGGVSSSDVSTSTYTDLTVRSLADYKLIRLNTSYYAIGLPDYGGTTVSLDELKAANQEAIRVTHSDGTYGFGVKYKNDTTLSVAARGTQGINNCLSIHGIMK